MKYYVLFFVVLLGVNGCGTQKAISNQTPTEVPSNGGQNTIEESKILYLVDGREISKEEINLIDPDTIEKIDVIKDKAGIKKYTSEYYDGIVAIYLKKK